MRRSRRKGVLGQMFEKYTEKARRVIFYARYEASEFGTQSIETEHILLGLLREEKLLTDLIIRSHASVELIKKRIAEHFAIREKIPTSVDLPLSDASKRVLGYAEEEMLQRGDKRLVTGHLLLGVLREETSFAAVLLKERGVEIEEVRKQITIPPGEPGA